MGGNIFGLAGTAAASESGVWRDPVPGSMHFGVDTTAEVWRNNCVYALVKRQFVANVHSYRKQAETLCRLTAIGALCVMMTLLDAGG
ncbi:hypothetical protein [Bradyrhizobium sp. Y36]|uniref:hypothetical protein n=1 Tax=Bradyrhizobium sp. Y36 TaxID=2035447 RepID=UPI001177B873|nr:hypothetical protein [Bradyrhizobium sp. Y36]